MTQHPDDGVLHALLDGEIRAAELPAIEAHLRSCAACLTRLEEARAFREEAERLVSQIEVPATEEAAPAAAAASAVGQRPPRRVELRPLAYAATLIAAVGLGYGMRGWGGSAPAGGSDSAAEPPALAAAPARPSESTLTDLVNRPETPSSRTPDDTERASTVVVTPSPGASAPRVLARQKSEAPPVEESPAARPPAPALEGNRLADARQPAERRFEGKVTDERGRGIGGASIVIRGTGLQARTEADGAYRLEGNIPDSAQVSARAVGYQAAAKTLSISDSGVARVDFELPAVPYRLDEVVVSGAERRAVSALRSPIVLRTDPPAFQGVDFAEAVRRLGGRIRLLDGLVPNRLEALGDTVRVGYQVGRGGELVWLRQFRVGDTVAFALLPPAGFPADSLARLMARVTP